MRQELIIQGVPDRIKRDAWWLETISTPHQEPQGASKPDGPLLKSLKVRHAIPTLAALIALADWLFWNQPVGISVAVFALVFAVAIMAARPERPSTKQWLAVISFTLMCNLPVAVDLTPLSLMFTFGGLLCLSVWIVYGSDANERLVVRSALRMPTVGGVLLVRDIIQGSMAVDVGSGARARTASLLLPLLMGSVFLTLLASANPLLEDYLVRLDPGQVFELAFWQRMLFWALIAFLLWPYLNLNKNWMGSATRASAAQKAGPRRSAYLVNPVSVRNSLFLFNILFLVQSIMDLGILTGGVALPDGMTYAEYAHRGAYPLVITALLAGVFTLITHNMIRVDRTLRALVYLWLVQNVFLVFTAAFRLQLYVEAYALTHLRVAAFIWMGLVMVGLALTVLQIHRGHSKVWLLRRCFAAGLVTLYTCCFVNFSGLIASYNLRHGDVASQDTYYVCRLGADAFPAIHAVEIELDQQICGRAMLYDLKQNRITNWREWGFRRWRIQAYYRQQN